MEKVRTHGALLRKYDVPTPRYTSYPAVPDWDTDSFNYDQWAKSVHKTLDDSNSSKGISIYIHLPFCESLCTYCACTTRITQNHKVEIPYIQAVLKEWTTYRNLFGKKPVVREIHLGGGTPTFFSAQNLHWLISYLLEDVEIHPQFEFSLEGHPNNTTKEHLRTLFDLGFSRVSFGVQDLDDKVQQTIHRVQPVGNLQRVTNEAREIGYDSISFDLIYGLPFQNPFTISDTFDKILLLRPDRLSFYSYAHVPWLKPGQRGYEDVDLPSGPLKRHLYEIGRHKLRQAEYTDIGMDHFALRTDSLFKAHVAGKVHRNFMGYTTSNTELLIGLGASAICDAKLAYGQNAKKVEDYLNAIKEKGNAITKGHLQTKEDILVRDCILQLSCKGELSQALFEQVVDHRIMEELAIMEKEGIIYLLSAGLKVSAAGEPFIRNICRVFDKRIQAMPFSQTYSSAI